MNKTSAKSLIMIKTQER